MKAFIVFAAVLVAVNCRPNIEEQPTPQELLQNKNAKYYFKSAIDDKINDGNLQRTEHREGLKVHGSYSSSDGFFKRTVNYVADEEGYRVTSELVEPLSGPRVNPTGTADVDILTHGNHVKYTIQSVPATDGKTRIVDLA